MERANVLQKFKVGVKPQPDTLGLKKRLRLGDLRGYEKTKC